MGKWQTRWYHDDGRKEEEWSETCGQVCSFCIVICMNMCLLSCDTDHK